MLSILSKYWKEIAILALVAILNYGIYRPVAVEVRTVYRTVEVDRTVATKTKTKQIKVVKPDGTKTTEIQTETTAVERDHTKTSENASVSTTSPQSPLSRYSLDVLTRPLALSEYGLIVGARLGNLPAFGTLGYLNQSLYIGARFEW